MNSFRFSFYAFLLAVGSLSLAASCGGNANNGGNSGSDGDGSGNYSSGPEKYRIAIRTGCEEDASTKAKVYIQLKGDKGVSKEFLLDNPLGDEFLSCSRDVFEIEVEKDIGKLTGLFFSHDNSGDNPSHKVEIIDVTFLKTGKRQGFPCGKWFATDKDDSKTKREFFDYRECK